MKFLFKRLFLALFLMPCLIQSAYAGWIPSWISSQSFQSVKNFVDDHQIGLLTAASLGAVGAGLGYMCYKNFWQEQQKPAKNNVVAFPFETVKEVVELTLITNMLPQTPVDKTGQDNLEDIFLNNLPVPHDKEAQDTLEDQLPTIELHSACKTPEIIWASNTFHEWHEICNNLKDYQLPHERLLKKGREGQKRIEAQNNQLAITYEELNKALDHYFIILNANEFFKDPYCWVGQDIPEDLFESLSTEKNKAMFEPFVQKLVVNPGCTIAFHGDVHGDIKSLNAFIEDLQKYLDPHNPFKILDPNFYIIFLGDYTDRGWYGAEVIYTILRLKCENPNQVFMVRGNHDDRTFNAKEQARGLNSFFGQLNFKYGTQPGDLLLEKIAKFYESLPLALYCGSHGIEETNYMLCCHGGVEIGFNPIVLLEHESPIAFTKLGALDRQKELTTLLNSPDAFELFKNANPLIASPEDLNAMLTKNLRGSWLPWYMPAGIITQRGEGRQALLSMIGYQWNDYEVNPLNEINWFVKPSQGRGLIIGKTFNQAILQLHSTQQHKVRGVFRAHQQSMEMPMNPMMKRIFNSDNLDHNRNRGVGKLWIDTAREHAAHSLWDNIVCTFNVCPHTPYQKLGYTYDTYGLLTTANTFDAWHLLVKRIEMIKPAIVEISLEQKSLPQKPVERIQESREKKQEVVDDVDKIANDFIELSQPDEMFTVDDVEFIMV